MFFVYLGTVGNSISIFLCVQTYFEIDNEVDFDLDNILHFELCSLFPVIDLHLPTLVMLFGDNCGTVGFLELFAVNNCE